MSGLNWVAVDISKNDFTAARRNINEIEKDVFSQDTEGFEAFLRWLPNSGTAQVCMESTGPYWRALSVFLTEKSTSFSLVNPRRVRNFAKATAYRSKTDEIDSEVILLFAETFDPQPTRTAEETFLQLRCLSRHRLQLQQILDTVRDQRRKAAADPSTPSLAFESFKTLEKTLRQQVDNTLAQAVDLVRSSPNLRDTFSLLVTIPGVGAKTAITLIGEFGPRIQTATPRQMTSFAGLDPVLWESGSSVRRKPRISKQGNHRIRKALYMAALVASWANPVLSNFYQRLINRGIPKKAAIIAVMRKLLHIVSGVIKHRRPFNPNVASCHSN